MTARPDPAAPLATYAALGATTLIWGSTFLAISIGNDTVPPVWAAALRLGLAATVLLLIALVRRERLPRGPALSSSVLYGFFQLGGLPLLYWAETQVPSGLGAIIFATFPLNTAILARAFGLEPLTARKVSGALLAFAGVAIIYSAQVAGLRADPLRLWAVVAATWAASLGTVILKRGPRVSPIGANAVGATTGFLVCCLISVVAGEARALPTSFAAVFPIVYLALAGSVGAFVIWVWLLNRSDVTRISYVSVVTPIVALALGVLVRHERLAPASVAGSLVVLAGVAMGVRAPRPAARASRGPPGDLAPPPEGE